MPKQFRPKIKIESFVGDEPQEGGFIGAFLYADSAEFEDSFKLQWLDVLTDELSPEDITNFSEQWRERASRMNLGFEIEELGAEDVH